MKFSSRVIPVQNRQVFILTYHVRVVHGSDEELLGGSQPLALGNPNVDRDPGLNIIVKDIHKFRIIYDSLITIPVTEARRPKSMRAG